MRTRPRPQVNRTQSGPAPVGGLNVRDAINMMASTDAIELKNWVPQQYGVRCRKGYLEWATGMVSEVKTIASYQPDRTATSSYKLFAFTDSNIYDITTSTSTPASVLVLPGTDGYGRWTTTMMANSAGTFLLGCSHVGGYKYYNGTTWTTPTMGAGAGQVNGVDPLNLCFVTTWKRRAWFIEKNTANVWYAPVDSITGTFTKFDLGPFMKHGGSLAFIATWTIDAGEGIDDFIVFGGENGDVLIYKGTDPASASTFSLQGAWYIGAMPLGRRNFEALGGDLLILSEMGLQPLSYVTRGGQSLLRAGSTDYLGKIQPRLAELVADLGDDLGWELTLYPKDNLLVIQKPTGGFATFEQYALYTNTNGWTLFDGMPMTCSHVANNDFYFGASTGKVYLGFSGFFDNVLLGASTGSGIAGLIRPAFSYFGSPGTNKGFLMCRPNFLATDRPSTLVNMVVDYKPYFPQGQPVVGEPGGALWDTAKWDQDKWAGGLNLYQDWYSVGGNGYSGSVALDTVCVGDTFLASIDYIYEMGGAL